MGERSNYYEILGLAPSVDDLSRIETRIKERKQHYDRIRPDAPKSQQREAEAFKILLDKPEEGIKAVMLDPIKRKAEAEARLIQLKAEMERLAQFLNTLRSRGNGYTKQDIKRISDELSGFDEAEIESRIKAFGIQESGVQTAKKPKRTSSPKLSDAEGSSIDADLKGLQLRSLYAFVGSHANQRSSQAVIERSIEEQENALKKQVRGTPEHKVRSALLGHAKKHLLNPTSRQKYDAYLADSALRKLDPFIMLRGGDTKVIDEGALNDIIRDANVPDFPVERVRDYVEEWVERTKGWVLALSPKGPIDRLLICGFCGELAKSESEAKCHACGRPLRLTCPNSSCPELVPVQDVCCLRCGYSTRDWPYIDRLLREGKNFFRAREYVNARHSAIQALVLWPDYHEAVDLIDTINKELEGQERERLRIEALRIAAETERNRLSMQHAAEHNRIVEQQRAARELQIAQEKQRKAELQAERERREAREKERLDQEFARQRRHDRELEAKRVEAEIRRNEEILQQQQIERRSRLVAQANAALRDEPDAARRKIEQLVNEWPNDAAVQMLATELQNLTQKEVTLSEIHQACATRSFMAALAKTSLFRNDEIPAIRNKTRAAINRADSLIRKGDQLRCDGDDVAAREKYNEALEVCVDHTGARLGLQQLGIKAISGSKASKFEPTMAIAESAGVTVKVAGTRASVIVVVFLVLGMLIVFAGWALQRDERTLTDIERTALENEEIDRAVLLMNDFVDDDRQRSDLAVNRFVGTARRYGERAKQLRQQTESSSLIASRDAYQRSARLFRLATEAGFFDGKACTADCIYWCAEVSQELGETEKASQFFSEASALYQAAADSYRNAGDLEIGDSCKELADECDVKHGKLQLKR